MKLEAYTSCCFVVICVVDVVVVIVVAVSGLEHAKTNGVPDVAGGGV